MPRPKTSSPDSPPERGMAPLPMNLDYSSSSRGSFLPAGCPLQLGPVQVSRTPQFQRSRLMRPIDDDCPFFSRFPPLLSTCRLGNENSVEARNPFFSASLVVIETLPFRFWPATVGADAGCWGCALLLGSANFSELIPPHAGAPDPPVFFSSSPAGRTDGLFFSFFSMRWTITAFVPASVVL